MYKYEMFAKEIVTFLTEKRNAGRKTFIMNAKDVEQIFNVSERCGGKKSSRFPTVCHAMDVAAKTYPCKYVCGVNPSTTYTVEYQL